jgi:hypothetical protein
MTKGGTRELIEQIECFLQWHDAGTTRAPTSTLGATGARARTSRTWLEGED